MKPKNLEEIKATADMNLYNLMHSFYPGRGFIIGLDGSGRFIVIIYFLQSRSEINRNRVLLHDEKTGKVWVEKARPDKNENTSLILYPAMMESDNGIFLVSNGEQTEPILQHGFEKTMHIKTYEPDSIPTPRISAVCCIASESEILGEMAILKKSLYGDGCVRLFYPIDVLDNRIPGIGQCMQTYRGGQEDPPMPFDRDPYLLPLTGDIDQILRTYWNAMNKENKISVAVKFIDTLSKRSVVMIENRYEQAAT